MLPQTCILHRHEGCFATEMTLCGKEFRGAGGSISCRREANLGRAVIAIMPKFLDLVPKIIDYSVVFGFDIGLRPGCQL